MTEKIDLRKGLWRVKTATVVGITEQGGPLFQNDMAWELLSKGGVVWHWMEIGSSSVPYTTSSGADCSLYVFGFLSGLALLSCQRCFLLLISMQVLPPFPLSSLAGLYFDLQSSICNYLR